MGKIKFEPVPQIPLDELDRHRAYSRGLGLPALGSTGAERPELLVLGGSPEINRCADEIHAWLGEIWAINGTYRWCRERGIPATLYRTDPLPPSEHDLLKGVPRAVLADIVHPDFFDALRAEGTAIEIIHFGEDLQPQTTAAASAPALGIVRGHPRVTIFGCESSFGAQTHAFKAEQPNLMWVECGGEAFVTSPQMVMQAESLAEAGRAYPQLVNIASGGFLGALTRHGDYSVTHVCRAIDKALKETAT